tara:strand:+ start:1094 stop:2326 length:1233 start_codon:yes stop_codon:yes gene_type:complete
MKDIKDFSNLVPKEISDVCKRLWEHGCSPCVVGGIPRDFLLGKKELLDWDFEVRSVNGNDDVEKLILQAYPETQSLGFGVYRLNLSDNSQLEFSIPRLENFPVEIDKIKDHPLSHKDFEVALSPNASFIDSFKRRDLTINAIGFDYQNSSWALVDPYNGVSDLKSSVARPCSEDFAFDPVRYLRSLRFELLFNLNRSKELDDLLFKMDLSLATDHYLLYEAMKAGFFPFMSKIFSSLKSHNVSYPETWDELEFLDGNSIEAKFTTADQVLMYAVWLSDWNLSELGKVERFLKLRRGRAKHFLLGKSFFNKVIEVDWNKKVSDLKSMAWTDQLKNEEFLELFEAHKHFDSWTKEEEENLVFLFDKNDAFSNWRKAFPRVLSGRELFDKNQKTESVTPSQRSLFKLHCHIGS